MWDEVADEGDSAAGIVELEEGIEKKTQRKREVKEMDVDRREIKGGEETEGGTSAGGREMRGRARMMGTTDYFYFVGILSFHPTTFLSWSF